MKTALLLLSLSSFVANTAHAAPPVIDGNLADFITYGESLRESGTGYFADIIDNEDVTGVPVPENIYSDAKFIPCPLPQPALGTHWANGAELFYHYVAYVPGSTHLLIALSTEGAIGDVDGDGDPDLAGSGGVCNPQVNIEDAPGISQQQFYEFRFDLNCDGAFDAGLKVEENQLIATGLFAGATGVFAYRKDAATGASGHDLEIDLQIPAPLPSAFSYLGVRTNAFDGLTEDSSSGMTLVPYPILALGVTPGPIVVCAGESSRIAITVSNTGRAPLSIDLSDRLPAGFEYAGKLSSDCGVGEPLVNGSVLTFPTFQLALGATCSVAFDVASTGSCLGDGDNVAEVAGTFFSPCISGGGSDITTSQAVTVLRCDPAACAPAGTCRLTGGGCLNEEGDQRGKKQSTFGGNSSPLHDGGGPSGNSWEHIEREGRTIQFNWHSWDAHVTGCSVVPPGPCSPKAVNTRADFVGTGKYSLGTGGRSEPGNMVAYVIDHREGSCNRGTRDEYSITVRSGLEIGKGEVVYETSGEIDCGNLQIHETPARLFGNDVSLPSGEGGIALLNRAYPNPFSASTSFAYRVGEGGSAVSVGVFDVAGRLVKTLAGGSQAAGTYTVTWDGSDASGVRMAPGVYFLKSRVGGEQVVSRLIYVAR